MFPAIITVLLLTQLAATVADDVACLHDFKSSVSDPETTLWSWTFSNVSTNNFLCGFLGVLCWHIDEDRVMSLSLPSASLSGSIPSALRLCSSITSLDLSDNNFSGPIPASLCTWLPYLVVLNLSSNSLSGPIPPQLSSCIYLNKLDLSSNLLSGSIPPSLSFLPRLRSLDLSDNDLSGLFPAGLFKFGAASFSHNPSLCGHPFSSDCKHGVTKNISALVNLAAGTIGFFLSIAICYILSRFCMSVGGGRMRKKKTVCCLDQVTSFSRSGNVRVSLFQDPVEEVMLADLTAATADFHPDNVVVAGNPDTGTSYKAILHDGSALTVKRLHGCSHSQREFRVEMETLGQIRHPNLVPLLGFCFLEREKLLIYKNMSNGALSLHLRSGCESLGWPKRLRIALGVARGLAWLHHGFQTPLTHWNLNTSAVLLDEDDEPRIADFGLNRLFSTSASSATSEDVYQFGMLLLKLVTDGTAMENSDEELADRVVPLLVAGWVGETIDPCLRRKGNEDEIVELLTIGCRCLVACAEERPPMFQVLKWLERIGGRVEFQKEFDEFPLLYGCE